MDAGRLHLDLEDLAQRLWDETIVLARLAEGAAIAEAAYRSAYARALLRAKADHAGTIPECEALATTAAEKEYLERRIAEARLQAQRELVATLRAELDVVRTMRADMRRAT